MRRALIIAVREYLSFLRTPGFWISLLVMPLIATFSVKAPGMVEHSAPPPRLVVLDLTGPSPEGVTRPGEALSAYLTGPESAEAAPAFDRASLRLKAASTGRARAELVPTPADLAAARTPEEAARLARPYVSGDKLTSSAGKLSAVAILSGDEKALKADIWTPSPEVVGVAEVLRAPLDRWVRQARLARAGLKPELAAALDKDLTEVRGFSPKAAAGLVSWKDRLPSLAAVGLSCLLWMLVMTSAGVLLNTVIEEKANRVIEVLISSASVTEILAGKILGGMALSFSMVAFWGGGGLWFAAHASPDLVPGILGALAAHGLIFWFLAFFLVGYLMYAAIFAAIGSFCETPREAQTLLGPIMVMLMAPILFLSSAITHPDAPLLRTMAWFPPFTPFLMTVRVAAGASLFELFGALLMMAGTATGVVLLAGRAFRAGALASEKPDLKKLISALRNA